jgi:hypothetical protein
MSVLLAMLVLGVLLVGAGAACGRLAGAQGTPDPHEAACLLLTGWAILCLVAVLCAASGAALTGPVLAVGVAGFVGCLAGTRAALGLSRLALAWLLLLPLLLMASVIPPFMADEFPALLPNAKGLLTADMFPDRAHPNVWTSKPEYPPALPLIGYVAARFGGADLGYPAKIFNVMLAGAFALVLAELIVRRMGLLAAVAIGVVLATLVNPFFDPRLALSAYNDTTTGFVVAICVATSWRALDEPTPRWLTYAAAAAIVLILLRETNLVLVVALAAGVLACRRPRIAIIITLPAFVAFALWRVYVMRAGWSQTMTVQPFAEWDWSAPFLLLRGLFGDRLANNPVLGAGGAIFALAAVILCVWLLRAGSSRMRALFVLTGAVGAAWVGFVAWAYIAVFPDEAGNANWAWRYLSQLGPMLIFAIVAALTEFLPARAAVRGRTAMLVAGAASLVAIAVPPVTSTHWRVDCRFADVVLASSIGEALHALAPDDAPMAVVNPHEPNWYAEAIDYALGRPVRSTMGYRELQQVPLRGYRLDMHDLDRSRITRDGVIPKVEVARWDGSAWAPVLTIAGEAPRACGASPFERWNVIHRTVAAR